MSERLPVIGAASKSTIPSASTTASPREVSVEISDAQGHLQFDGSTMVLLVQTVLALEKRHSASISLVFVDNAAIRELNRAHLGHDWATDVISFPLSGPGDPVLAGELVISTQMACETAEALGIEPATELALYVVHGLLHLCGHDDCDPAAERAMRRRESEVMDALGLPTTSSSDG
jgi:probable rRNA maturation factor